MREKGKAVEFSTEATATQGEKVIISIATVLFIALVVGAIVLIGLGHIAMGICCAVLGIVSVVACLLIPLLNPKHRQELLDNATAQKITIDYKENAFTDKVEDNTVTEDVTADYIGKRK